jgi:hypothetical protein
MAELDEIRQSLLLAKEALRAPAAARVRLRNQLAATGAWPAAPGAPGNASAGVQRSASSSAARLSAVVQHPVAAWTAALLLGVGFGAGYWVGHNERTLTGTVSTPGATAVLSAPERSAALSPAGNPSTSTEQRSYLERATLDHSMLGHDSTLGDPTARGDAVLGKFWAPDPTATSRSAMSAESKPIEAGTKPLPHSSRHAPRASGTPHAFAAELTLVQRAERAIRAHDPELALSLLRELDHAFPTPALREERRAARLLAECERAALNRSDTSATPSTANEPRARAEQFLAEQPGSVYSDRIRKICALGGSAAVSTSSAEGSADPGH